jgi:hypothetical protein
MNHRAKSNAWAASALRFIESLWSPGSPGYPSVPGGFLTLYGTCYALATRHFLGDNTPVSKATKRFLTECQDENTGLMVGPELKEFTAAPGVMHDREHLLLHLSCAAIPTCQHFGIPLRHKIASAHRFCDLGYLKRWLDRRSLKDAWFEGNNFLFVGQLLIHLRDVENYPGAQAALNFWFEWLDTNLDPNTGLWGTNGFCSAAAAVYGGYHQLLVYHFENHGVTNPEGMIDTVLALQHADGGFNPDGNAGGCEDVDSVDILVNLYKRINYRRADIRVALRGCVQHILSTQNPDGGFPYNRNCEQSHMGIPGTQAAPNVSTTFATWFRVHTLALAAEILPEDEEFKGLNLRFSNSLSMGWHRSPAGWLHHRSLSDRFAEVWPAIKLGSRKARAEGANQRLRIRRFGSRVLRKLNLR